MNRNQLFVLLGIVLVFGAIALIAWVAIIALAPQQAAPLDPAVEGDPFGSITIPGSVSGESQLTLVTSEGETLSVPDFTKGKEPITFAGESYYFVYGPEYSNEGFDFSVQYQAADSSFLVELLTEPIGEAREKAAAYLGELLRLPAASLCEVRVRVVVGASVNQQFSGYEDLGLGGCPGSAQLP